MNDEMKELANQRKMLEALVEYVDAPQPPHPVGQFIEKDRIYYIIKAEQKLAEEIVKKTHLPIQIKSNIYFPVGRPSNILLTWSIWERIGSLPSIFEAFGNTDAARRVAAWYAVWRWWQKQKE